MRSWLTAILTATMMVLSGCDCDSDRAVGQAPDLGGEDGGGGGGAEPSPDLGPPDVAAEPAPDLGPDGPPADGWTGDGPSPDALAARACNEVEPPAGTIEEPVLLFVTGDGFAPDAELQLEVWGGGTIYPLSPTTVTNLDGDSDGERASATIDADMLPQGLYEVQIVTSGDTLVCGPYNASAAAPPTVIDVIADSSSASRDRLVTIVGTGFAPTPSVRFRRAADPGDFFDASQVDYLSDGLLSVLVPSASLAMPIGDYLLFVRNPDLLGAQWCPAGACVDADEDGLADNPEYFHVLLGAPPEIDNAHFYPEAPCPPAATERIEGQCCSLSTPLEIVGQNFDPAATITLFTEDGTNVCTMTGLTDCSVGTPGTCLQGPTCTCDKQIFGVRVDNPDGQFDTFYVVEVTSSADGHIFGAWEPMPTEMLCGRERHVAVGGRDHLGGAHLYAMGGTVIDDPGNPSLCDDTADLLMREASDTVERTGASVFGSPGPWSLSEQYFGPSTPRALNTLTTPRTGATGIRIGRYIYVMGGADTDTRDTTAPAIPALDTVEIARILDWEGRPLAAAPTAVGGACDPEAEPCLPGGAWFYRVSAVGAAGETLPSPEVSRRSVGGRLRVCWLPVAGATGYNVYRSLGEDGRGQSTRLLRAEPPMAGALTPGEIANVDVGGANMLCFLDNGGDLTDGGGPFLVPAPGRARGTLGAGGTLGDPGCAADVTYSYRIQAEVENASAATNETLAGYAAGITVRTEDCTAGTRTITVAWDELQVAGSSITEYRVYRDQIPGEPDPRRMGLLAVVTGAPPTASFLDDGSVAFLDQNTAPPDGTPPLPLGSLSLFELSTVTLTEPREGADSVVITVRDRADPPLPDRTFIFITGGRTASTGGTYLTTTERLELDVDGLPLDPAFRIVSRPGGVTPIDLSAPRVFFPLLTNNEPSEPAQPPDPCPNPDADGDGFISCECGGNDCDDTDPNINPDAGEICGNGIDEDCSGGCGVVDDLPCGVDPDMGLPPDGAEPAPDIGPLPDGAAPDMGPPPDGPVPCIDADGDGHENVGCGGDDCNDNDPTICPSCEEILCDGIDQDCDFIDPPCHPRDPGIFAPVDPDPPLIYLIALAGDDVYAPGAGADNEPPGPSTGFDYCKVDDDSTDDGIPGSPALGDLVCEVPTLWTRTPDDTSYSANLGHDGLLYLGWIYMIGGATKEWDQDEPQTDGNVWRWEFIQQDDFFTPVGDQRQSSSANFTPGRAYPAVLRINSKLWIIGGNEGAGPVRSVLRHDQ